MKRLLQPRHRRGLFRALAVGLFWLAAGNASATIQATLSGAFAQGAFAAAEALPATIVVTTLNDDYDSVAPCSLREAIQSSNDDADFGGCTHTGGALGGTTIISVPVGTYTLTRDGIDDDANLSADLDIDGSVTLDGNIGAGNAGDVVIKGKAGYSGRIMHVISGTVTIKDMTLRDGHLPGGRFGGGLRANAGTTTILTDVVVGVNSADRGGGGILNEGAMTLNGSAVTNNQALLATDFGGGGILNAGSGTLTLNDSRVLNNVVKGNNGGSGGGKGGGIFNEGLSLTLDNSEVDGNLADEADLVPILYTSGGGIYSTGNLTITQSTISNNTSRGNDGAGGGVACGGEVVIDRSLVTANHSQASPDLAADGTTGGGVECSGQIIISNSVISNNDTDSGGTGGGGLLLAGTVSIINSTINGNRAKGSFVSPDNSGVGAGILFNGTLAMINSTVSGNDADGNGGGIYASGDLSLFNVTVANNTSNADFTSGGTGGGIYVSSAEGGTVTMRNSVLAGNVEGGIGNNDDCDGTIASGGNNVVQVINAGCSVIGGGASDLLGIDAKLGAFAANGGPIVGASVSPIVAGMGTHLPAGDSPVVDHGDPTGCKDEGNVVVLTTDQRGFLRPVDGSDPDSAATCDSGAVEAGSFIDVIFVDDFDQAI